MKSCGKRRKPFLKERLCSALQVNILEVMQQPATETPVQKLKLLCCFKMYHQVIDHSWFNFCVIPERNEEKKIQQEGACIFFFLSDANG